MRIFLSFRFSPLKDLGFYLLRSMPTQIMLLLSKLKLKVLKVFEKLFLLRQYFCTIILIRA